MKNKKTLLIIGILFLLFVSGGILVIKPKENKIESKNIFTSVKDALSQKLTLACEFTDETGATTKSYIKNGAVRVSSTGNSEQTNEIIIKDKKMYMWDDKKKQGFMYIISDEAKNSQTGNTNQDVVSSQSYLNMIDKYKDSCKVATVADSYFVVPTDVNFQDMAKLLEDLQKQAPQINTPSN